MEQLDDIYIASESIWWNLLQPGWISLVLFLILTAAAFLLFLKQIRPGIQRRRFTEYLKRHEGLSASQINAILKAYIGQQTSATQVTNLHGQAWRNFLLGNCNMQGYMQQLDYLVSGYYQKQPDEPPDDLSQLAIHWIRNHKKHLS